MDVGFYVEHWKVYKRIVPANQKSVLKEPSMVLVSTRSSPFRTGASWILGLHLADEVGPLTETLEWTSRSRRELEDRCTQASAHRLGFKNSRRLSSPSERLFFFFFLTTCRWVEGGRQVHQQQPACFYPWSLFQQTMSLPFICVSVRVTARTSADSTHCPTIAFTFARHMNIPVFVGSLVLLKLSSHQNF